LGGWHQFQIEITDVGTKYKLDGVDVGQVGPLSSVGELYLSGVIDSTIHNDGSHAVYFDDFNFTPVVPEPKACWAVLVLLMGLSMRMMRRRSV
jgi:hypothetical protein